MDLQGIFQQFAIFQHLTAFLLGMPRLFALALVTPFLGTGVLEGQIWLVLVLGMYLPLHPLVLAQLSPEFTLSFNMSLPLAGRIGLIFLKESVLGLCLGFLAGLPFWAVQDAGVFMDNQRGASQSEGTEILTGKSVSPMGGLLFQCLIYLFYVSGAFVVFLGLIYASYEIWPVTSFLPMPKGFNLPLFFAEKLAWFATYTMLVAAPVAVVCLLVDISLGLINRFSPQLNAYVLAMPIKSGLAAVLLFFYFGLLINQAPFIFHFVDELLGSFTNLLRA